MAFTTFSPNTVIKSAEINENFNLKADKASPTFTGTLTAAIVNATTVIGTTITATSLVATTLTATSIQATTLTSASIVGTTITATTLVSTSLTVSSAINLTGGKIQFPSSDSASADANCFDDYEEGTWTPVLTASSGTITSYSSAGRYQKIANRVYFRAFGNVTNEGTGSGLRMTLPFTAAAQTYAGFGREISATGNILQGEVSSGGTFVSVYLYNNGDACVTGYQCVVCGFYEV